MMSTQTARRLLAFVALVVAECVVFAWLRVPEGLDLFLSILGGGGLALYWHRREIRALRARRRRVGPPLEWID